MTPWYTTEQVAAHMQVSPRTVQRWARDRLVPHIRIGRQFRFTAEQVEEIQATYTRQPEVPDLDVDVPNPSFDPSRAVVVPMRRGA